MPMVTTINADRPLAHELNQPITAVTNYVEAVRDLLDAPDPAHFPIMHEALDDTAREALRAGHIASA